MPIKQKLVIPMRETMPFFVSSLRAIDDWKRNNAKRADAITQAEHEANEKYIKSPFARSMNIEDLLRFLDDTVLDINFMVQLPSIEKCLDKWWRLYAREKHAIDQDILRNVYYDLAFILVEAKTETLHKNSVSMIMRGTWTKWSPKEPPLGKREFFRLLFILAHLMTTTDRLGDYVAFFHNTMGKIARHYQQKQMRTQQHSRRPRMRRKSTLDDILKSTPSSPKLVSARDGVGSATLTRPGAPLNQVLNVQIPMRNEGYVSDEDQGDCFVELLERNSRYQRVVVDPLLHDKRFQEKFKQPGGGINPNKTSTNDMLAALNPTSNKYCPPLLAVRLRTNGTLACTTQSTTTASRGLDFMIQAASSSQTLNSSMNGVRFSDEQLNDIGNSQPASEQRLRGSESAPVIAENHLSRKFEQDWNTSVSNDMSLTHREEELMRRSLSRVSLKVRVNRNKAAGEERLRNRGHKAPRKEKVEKEEIYLAIST